MPKPRKPRLDLRMTPDVLVLLKRAPEIEGRSFGGFRRGGRQSCSSADD